MSKPVWYCQEISDDGGIVIAVDQILDEGLAGYRRYIHPFDVDNSPILLLELIAEMSEIMGRMSAPPHPTSRACAFGGGQ